MVRKDYDVASDQLSLAGFAPVRVRADHWSTSRPVFFGLLPPEPARAQILTLARDLNAEMGLGARPHRNPHVSLIRLGERADLPPDMLEVLCAVGRAVRFPSFEVVFDRAESFGRGEGDIAYVLRAGGGEALIVALGQTIRRGLIAAGLARPCKWSFTPHLTLFRARQTESRATAPIGWTVRQFALIHSDKAKGRYDVLGRFDLYD